MIINIQQHIHILNKFYDSIVYFFSQNIDYKKSFIYTGLLRHDNLANLGYVGLYDELAVKESFNFKRNYYNILESNDIFDVLDDIVINQLNIYEYDPVLRISHYPPIIGNIKGSVNNNDEHNCYRLVPHYDYGLITLYYEYQHDSGFEYLDADWKKLILKDDEMFVLYGNDNVKYKPTYHRVVNTPTITERFSFTYHVDIMNPLQPIIKRLGIK